MLSAGYASHPRLPQNDLVYVAFRVCFFDVFSELEMQQDIELDEEWNSGFLTHVPFFASVPPVVQLDLLAEVWAKHHSPELIPAKLLNAAILWSIFDDAGRIGLEIWEGDLTTVLEDGPRRVEVIMDDSLAEQWQEMFDVFWDDYDFLSLSDMLDTPPERARMVRSLLMIPEDWVDEMFDVLPRFRASPSITENLRGLLTDGEIADHRELLLPTS
jgi:hypothetical protein